MLKLNLGSGGRPLEGYVNVDNEPMENPDVLCDLGVDVWPFEDNSVDDVYCSHCLEHIGPEPFKFMHFMRELWRVCKNGAEIMFIVPNPRHDIFLNDPTHVRPVTPSTLVMFSKKWAEKNAEQGIKLTPFWKYNGIDFDVPEKVGINTDERGQVFEYHIPIMAVKP